MSITATIVSVVIRAETHGGTSCQLLGGADVSHETTVPGLVKITVKLVVPAEAVNELEIEQTDPTADKGSSDLLHEGPYPPPAGGDVNGDGLLDIVVPNAFDFG